MTVTVKNYVGVYEARIDLNGLTALTAKPGVETSELLKAVYAAVRGCHGAAEQARNARVHRVAQEIFHYSPPYGTYEARRALAEKFVDGEEDPEGVAKKALKTGYRRHASYDRSTSEPDRERGCFVKWLEGVRDTPFDKVVAKQAGEIFYDRVRQDGNPELSMVEVLCEGVTEYRPEQDRTWRGVTRYGEPDRTWTAWLVSGARAFGQVNGNVHGLRPHEEELANAVYRRIAHPDEYGKDDGTHRSRELEEKFAAVCGKLELVGNSEGVRLQRETDAIPPVDAPYKVKYFAGMRAFLTKTAREGDLVVLDHPESGLHPTEQVKLAEIVAIAAAESKIRFLVATDSPYLLMALHKYAREQGILEAGELASYIGEHIRVPTDLDDPECDTFVDGNSSMWYRMPDAGWEEHYEHMCEGFDVIRFS